MAAERSAGLSPHRGSLQAGGTTLSWLDWGGNGPTALLLHGMTSNAEAWWRVAPRLAEAGFRVVAFDMPGHGRSGEVADHRVESVAGLMAAAASSLGQRNVVLIGHSWGGSVALAMASGVGSLEVARLVLIDPALALTAQAGAQRVPVFAKGLGAPARSLEATIAAANPDWHENDVRWKAQAMQDCRFGAVNGFFTQSGDWDLTPRLAQVKVPLLLLVADPAATVIDAPTRAAAERHLDPGRARMVVLPGTSHNMYRGAGYEPTLALIVDWLGSK